MIWIPIPKNISLLNMLLEYNQSFKSFLLMEGCKRFKTILWTISRLWNSQRSHRWESNHAAGSFLAHIQSGRNKAGVIKVELIEQCNGNNSPPKQAQLKSKQWQKVWATSATKKLTPQSAKLRKGLSAILIHSFFGFNCTLSKTRMSWDLDTLQHVIIVASSCCETNCVNLIDWASFLLWCWTFFNLGCWHYWKPEEIRETINVYHDQILEQLINFQNISTSRFRAHPFNLISPTLQLVSSALSLKRQFSIPGGPYSLTIQPGPQHHAIAKWISKIYQYLTEILTSSPLWLTFSFASLKR